MQQPKLGEHFAPAQAIAGVHLEQPDGGSSRGGFSHNVGTLTRKVIGPCIASGMEQRCENVGVGVNTAQVGALLKIALGAGEREVGGVIGAAVLPGDDVFDVEAEGRDLLRETAVFATVARPLADKIAGGDVHLCGLVMSEKRVRLGLQDAKKVLLAHREQAKPSRTRIVRGQPLSVIQQAQAGPTSL